MVLLDSAAISDDAVTGSKISDSALGQGIDNQADVVGCSRPTSLEAPRSRSLLASPLINTVTSPIFPQRFRQPIYRSRPTPPMALPITPQLRRVRLSVSGTGAVSDTSTVTAGAKAKITYDTDAHVTAGADLESADLPVASLHDALERISASPAQPCQLTATVDLNPRKFRCCSWQLHQDHRRQRWSCNSWRFWPMISRNSVSTRSPAARLALAT